MQLRLSASWVMSRSDLRVAYIAYAVLVQTGSETVSGNMGMPRPEPKRSGIFGKIWDLDRDRGVWSGPDWVPIGPGPNFPNTSRQ